MKKKIVLGFFMVLLFSGYAFGGGTAFDAEVDSILDQQPHLASFVRSQLEFCKASWYPGIRHAGNYSLGGKRLGPYERRVRTKGSGGNFDVVLTVNTSYQGYDAKGKAVEVNQATRVDEKLASIDLRYEPCKEEWCKAPQQGAAGDAKHQRP